MIRFVHITDEDVEAFGGPMNPTNGRRFEDLKSSEPIRFLQVINFNPHTVLRLLLELLSYCQASF